MPTIIYDRGNQFERYFAPYSPESPAANLRIGSIDSMRENLEKSKAYPEKTGFIFYIPRHKLREIVCHETVRSALTVLSPRSDGSRLNVLCNTICGGPINLENPSPSVSFRQLFGILVYIGHAKDIFEFIARGIDDSKLPVSTTVDRQRLTSSHASGRQVDMVRPYDWDERVLDDFLRIQFAFIAPFFIQPRKKSILQYHLDTDEILQYHLDKDEILPMVQSRTLPREFDQSAIVECIELDPQHYDFGDYGFQNPEAPRQLFALKKHLNVHRFQAEVNFANHIRKIENDHISRLLVSFRTPEMNCLVYPWAECDMDSYWASHTPETWDVKWIAQQCCGLASALAAIHDYGEAQPHTGLPNDRRLYGRHGDIKPSNILWFKNHPKYIDSGGILTLNDFEFGSFNRESSRSMIRADRVSMTPKYEPPELDVDDGYVDRSLDIWCLGATFVELVTWRVRGYEAVYETFTEARCADLSYGGHKQKAFFRLTKKDSGAEVKPSVTAWIKDLRVEIRRRLPSAVFLDSLLCIAESDMLVVDAKRRIKAKELEVKLSRLLL